MKSVLDRILDGEDIRVVISESVFANDSFGYSLDTTLYYASETEVEDDLVESRSINEKVYSFDEVQDMVTDCHKDAKLKKRVLAELPAGGPLGKKDKADIGFVIDRGDAEYFDRFDSAVADNFIGAYLSAKGIDEAIVHPCRKNNGDLLRGIGTDRKSLTDAKETSYQEYKGYDISYNLYGGGEYTVQFDGDDVVFDTEKEAKDFIDSQVSGDGLDESYNGFDYFDIDVDFKVTIKKPVTEKDFDLITDHLNTSGFDGIPEIYDTDFEKQEFKVLVNYGFYGKIDYDEGGNGVRYWDVEGAPSDATETEMISSIKFMVARQSLHLDTVIRAADVDVVRIGKSVDDLVADVVNSRLG